MGWSGVWLVRRGPGESDQEAMDRTAAEWIEWDDDGVRIVPNADFEPGEDDDEFIVAVTALGSINPRLEVVDESEEVGDLRRVVLDDGEGSIVVNVYPGEVQLKPALAWSDPPGDDGAGFRALWAYMTAIGAAFDCAAHDPDFDEVFDLGLDEVEARDCYHLL